MRFFPNPPRMAKVRRTERVRLCKPRHRDGNMKASYDYRKEFDIIVQERYNELSAEKRKVLWTITGSLLAHTGTDIGSQRNPEDKLIKALEQAHKNLPK